MHAIINQQIGRIHHAAQHPSLTKTRPTYAFVPEQFFGEDGLNRSRYLTSRWPSINCTANPLGIGSHVIPDPARPVTLRSRCPILREFITRLEEIAAVKTATAA
jgi:hypothetical protein